MVFQNIQMPGLNGLQVAEALIRVPGLNVVFVTAYCEHAIDAFRVHAINYNLKPNQDEQIIETIHRVRQNQPPPNVAILLRIIEQIHAKPAYLTRLLVKDSRRSFIVQTDEIM